MNECFQLNKKTACSQRKWHIKILFIALSLSAVSMLPMYRIIEVKSLPIRRLRDPALRGNRLALSIHHYSIHQGIGH